MKKDTSWGEVAEWYDDLLGNEDSYQRQVILPNLLRIMDIKKDETVADLGCGSGFFSGQFLAKGARVVGVDISPELIAVAKQKHPEADFFVSPADDPVVLGNTVSAAAQLPADKAVCILAIQNIENVKGLFEGCHRMLVPGGSFYIVMNHPAFRIPQQSSWVFDEASGHQYRRIDQYLSEIKTPIVMNPGQKKSATTVSFHRPLQYYFKLLQAGGFSVSRLEEWISHKHSQTGPRQKEEDRTRKEFPLFLFLEAKRI